MDEKYDGLERYKGVVDERHRTDVFAYGSNYYVHGAVCELRRDKSLVELTRFDLHSFTVDSKETAEQIGLEICRMLIDDGLVKKES